MNILIIGNGFDLAHDLPTKYTDFLDFTNSFVEFENLGSFTEEELNIKEDKKKNYFKYYLNLKENNQILFQELNSLISKNFWMEFFQRIYLEQEREGKTGWVDFEKEISSVIQTFDAARKVIVKQNNGYLNFGTSESARIVNKLSEFIDLPKSNKIDDGFINEYKEIMIQDLNKTIRCLEIYLSDYVDKIQPTKILPDIEELQIGYVLNFNSTNTFNKIYDKKNELNYDYIHGEADIKHNIETCNMVLGIDEYLLGNDKDNDNEFVYFKKFFQRIYKKTDCCYRDWINKLNDPTYRNLPGYHANNIFIFGHSLDVTDKDILADLILLENTTTTIFYYNRETFKKEISNLIKVIGESNLIKMTDGSNPSIKFLPQKKAKNFK